MDRFSIFFSYQYYNQGVLGKVLNQKGDERQLRAIKGDEDKRVQLRTAIRGKNKGLSGGYFKML